MSERQVDKLQALVYDILPPFLDYATGLEKLSANEQFFDDAFVTDHVAYASTNKTQIV